jgi:hypothetical protein
LPEKRQKIDGEWYRGPYRLNGYRGTPLGGYDIFDRLTPKLRAKYRDKPYMGVTEMMSDLRTLEAKPRRKAK